MRVLIIEDEHKIANSIKKGLELEKYAADTAYTSEEGLDLATSEDYDLIILDVLLPGMNGVEVCQLLRKKGLHTPILMLTAKGQVQDKVLGLDAGADDYLTKPFAFEELLARIRALIRRPKEAKSQILKVSNLTLDTLSFEVKRAGFLIHLSSKEYSLLEYLMRHKNRVLTKDQIIAHVWDYDADVLPNTVEVYIGYLRQKIDKSFPEEQNLIETARGFGYKMKE